MRTLLLLLLAQLVVAGPQTTIDDMLDTARQEMRKSARTAPVSAEVPQVPPPEWSFALALAGTTVLLTAVLMAFAALLAEIGIGWRRPTQVRIRLVGWHDSLSQRHLPQVNLL